MSVHRQLAAALAAGALAWSALLLVAPIALTSRSPAAVTAAALLYDSSGLICHQRPERTFQLSGVGLPVCARCSGLYFSAALGALAAWMVRPREAGARASRILLGAAALPTAVTIALEAAGLAYPSNAVRAISALPLGFAAAALFISSLRSESAAG